MLGVVAALVLAAPGSGRVAAHAERCPPGFEAELRRLLTIELKAPVVDAAVPGDSSVHVRCFTERYRVVLTAPLHAPMALEVDTSALDPLAVPRAVTLVVAEALTALWRSPETQPAPIVEAPAPPPVLEPGPAAPRFEFALLGGARLAALPLFGGGVTFDVTALPWLGVRFDVTAWRGSAQRAAGRVVSTLLDCSAGVDLRWAREHVALRGGVGLRVGYVWLTGVPGDGFVGRGVGGALWGPQVSVGASWRPVTWLSFGVGADGGLWAPRVEGEVVDAAPVRIDGLFASLWLSAGVRW